MLSRSVRGSTVKNVSQLRTKLSQSVRNQSSRTADEMGKKPLQSSPVGFLVKALFFGGVAYTAAATVALNYEPFQEPFFEFVPYGEEYMDKLDYAWKHRQQLLTLDSSIFETKKNEIIHDINSVSTKVGLGTVLEEVEAPKAELKQTKEDQFIVLASPSTKKTDQAKVTEPKNEAVKVVKKFYLPNINIDTSEPEIKKTVDALNSLINSINSTNITEKSEEVVQSIKNNLLQVSEKHQKVLSGKAEDLKEAKDAAIKKFEIELAEKKVELTKDLTTQLEQGKKTIEEKFSKRLLVEIDETKKALALEAQNIISQSKADMTQQFIDIIEKAVSSERENKLKDLDAVAARVSKVEELESELSKNVLSFQNFKSIQKSITLIKQLLSENEPSPTRGQEIVTQLNKLNELTGSLDNDLIKATIASFPSEKEILSSGGTLTQSQLIERWNLLSLELRSVSLLPENAGLLGYLSSLVFSKFLFSKTGVPEKKQADALIGNDIEAVIARVNNYLTKNELDNAVEEVSLLKGTARQLSEDWLVESRRKLEIQFLTELLDSEIHVSF